MSKLRKKHKKNRAGVKVLIVLVALFLLSTILFLTAFSGLSVAVTGIIGSFMADLPDLGEYNPAEAALTSQIYAADGTLIATFHGIENREEVNLERMPQNLINAVVAIEDERYYQHKGVDPEGIIRAFIINLQTGDIAQGASTITQQVIRNLYIPEEKYEITYDRKIKEALLAYQLEKIYSKEEVLEMYLNTVYFGEGAYGVQAASKVYFNKNVNYLSLPEAALLAGMLRYPNKSPYIEEAWVLDRRNVVLSKMMELGYIDSQQYQEAINTPIVLNRPTEESKKGFAMYFVEYVKQQLIEKYGVNRVFKGGFDIYTTLEPDMQIAAEDAIEEILYDPEDPAAALVAIDPSTGYIKAMVGGKDFSVMKFNLATQAKRQPGSTFKVFALMAALEQGISPLMTFNPNGPVIFGIEGSEPWEVSNYMGTKYETDEMNIIDATISSVNVVYAQLIMKVGAYSMVDVAKRMGIVTDLEPYPAIGLGGLTIGVSPLEVCSSFATIANYGARNDPVAITKVTDNEGNVLEEHQPQPVQAISAINAYRAIEIMQQAVQRGTGTRARLEDRPVAGKTGTTQEAENAWFTGFTTNLAACVWIGYPEENIKMGIIHDTRVQGGTLPAMIWNLFMEEATKKLPAEEFVRPEDDLIEVQVVHNPETGAIVLPNRFTPFEKIELRQFHYGQEPRSLDTTEGLKLPNITLMPKDQANNILRDAGYTHIEFIEEVFGGVPPGYVHRQEPLWDEEIEPIRLIKVWVNPGEVPAGDPGEIIKQLQENLPNVPNIINLPWDQANHILVHSGYNNIEYIYEKNDQVPQNYTYDQQPSGGQKANLSQKIKVWVNP